MPNLYRITDKEAETMTPHKAEALLAEDEHLEDISGPDNNRIAKDVVAHRNADGTYELKKESELHGDEKGELAAWKFWKENGWTDEKLFKVRTIKALGLRPSVKEILEKKVHDIHLFKVNDPSEKVLKRYHSGDIKRKDSILAAWLKSRGFIRGGTRRRTRRTRRR
jgi:hypothetical protein